MREVAHAVVLGETRRSDFREKEGSAGRRRRSMRDAMVVSVVFEGQWGDLMGVVTEELTLNSSDVISRSSSLVVRAQG
jgi:hypothetical protein